MITIEKVTIGRNEHVSLPDLNLFNIDAKIDTGAYSSSIHCCEVHLNPDSTVHFKLLDEAHPEHSDRYMTMPVHKIKKVKSSNGMVQERIFVKTTVELGGKSYEAELSLTDRKDMKFPILIGRTYLQGHFIVDVSRQYCTSKN